MARFYTNENIASQLVSELRLLGHDVLTSFDAGNANQAIADLEVLAFATGEKRILLTYNRRHFLQLHQRRSTPHFGIVLCSVDLDYPGQAQRVQAVVASGVEDDLVRVNRVA